MLLLAIRLASLFWPICTTFFLSTNLAVWDAVGAEDGEHDGQVDEAVEHAHQHRQDEHLEEDDEDHRLGEAQETEEVWRWNWIDLTQSRARQNAGPLFIK